MPRACTARLSDASASSPPSSGSTCVERARVVAVVGPAREHRASGTGCRRRGAAGGRAAARRRAGRRRRTAARRPGPPRSARRPTRAGSAQSGQRRRSAVPDAREPVGEHLVDHRGVHPGRRRVVHGEPEVAGVGHVPRVQPATVEPAVAAGLVEQHAVAASPGCAPAPRRRTSARRSSTRSSRAWHHPRLRVADRAQPDGPLGRPTTGTRTRTGTTSPSRGVARRTYSSDPSWCGWSSRWRGTLIP